MQKPAKLRITGQFGEKKSVLLVKPVFTIGRKPGNDLHLLATGISRYHGQIVYEDENYYLVDQESKSGVFINDRRVTRQALKHLDRIRIGGHDDCQIQFIEETVSAIFKSSSSLKLSQVHHASGTSANEELRQLARFVEVNQAFRFSLTPDDVLCLIVDAAIEMTNAERGFLMLKNDAGNLEFKVARDNRRNLLAGDGFQMSRTVVEESFKTNLTVTVNDLGDSSVGARQSVQDFNLSSIACAPLRRYTMSEEDATTFSKFEVIGVLYVDSRKNLGAFSKTALTLLESLSFEASKSLENVRLMREEQEKQRLEREFTMAREVQVALLPTTFSQPDHFEVAAHSIPCRYVGGDFYDLFTLKDGRAGFVLADVSGKGIAAALLASMTQGVMQAQFNSGLLPAEVITGLNRVVVQKSAANRFVTLFCALVDSEGNFTFVNAGHNPAILVRADGSLELLSTKSLVVGAFDFAEYHESQIKLDPDDVVVVFSDGVTEAVNAANEMFGDDRLEKLVKRSTGLSAEEIKNRVIEAVLNFTRGVPQGDDITLVALKMKSGVQSQESKAAGQVLESGRGTPAEPRRL